MIDLTLTEIKRTNAPKQIRLTKYAFFGIHRDMWSVEFLDESVWAEMAEQPNDIRAKFERIVRLIQAHGLERVHEPYIKHLEGRLWEMRMKGRDTIARAIYVTAVEKRVVVVRVFTKKSRKTSRREIEIALKRAEEVAQ